jgi:glycosyltransferase involved in cell wall biosynthesis
MSPQLTVCIPAYNQPDFLSEALASLCDQGLNRDEYVVLVTDDASPADLGPVVDAFRDRLQLKYHRHDANVGHIRNYESALNMSATPFVSFLPHDDLVAPGQLGRALRLISADAECALVASVVICQSHPGSLTIQPHGFFIEGAARARFDAVYRWHRTEWMALSLITTPMSMVGSVMRSEVLARCPSWMRFPLWHDRVMLAELGLHGSVLSLPWIGGHYRVGPQQLSGQLWQKHADEFLDTSNLVLEWCEAFAVPVKDYWIDRICAAERADRVTYLQLLARAVPAALYHDIKSTSEARLGVRLHTSRLERLGVPRRLAAAARGVHQLLGRRLG